MADYTRLPLTSIRKILGLFGRDNVAQARAMPGGLANSSYFIDSKDEKYILTICNEKNFCEVKNLIDTLVILQQHSFPSPRLIKCPSGLYVQEYCGTPVIVKKYIDGEICRSLTHEMLLQVGKAIAQLHQIPSPPGIATQFPYGLEAFSEIFSVSHSYVDWLKQKKLELENEILDDLPIGLIHGDQL